MNIFVYIVNGDVILVPNYYAAAEKGAAWKLSFFNFMNCDGGTDLYIYNVCVCMSLSVCVYACVHMPEFPCMHACV